ncbi:MAG TPA: glycosyltransferase [Candidatus Acidoferrales bacterium]|nr:glycosyltransferase [Candidatus Acidoferrales bacterium]
MTFAPKVSVVVPLKRLNDYVAECLSHLGAQTYRNFDVYVITDEAQSLDVGGLPVHFLSSGVVPPNIKRMQAARESDAQLIALIDDDAYPTPHWLEHAVAHFADPNVIAVGGPAVTPPHDGAGQQVSGAVYASRLVSASYVYRYLPRGLREVDDYPSCNLIVRREPFLEHVPQCLRYWPGEDTKLCLLLTKDEGKRIVYDPEVAVFHHRRHIFWGHFKQVWNYAVHRGFFAKRYPETSLRPAYFIPTAFLFGNVVLLPLLTIPAVRLPVLGAALFYGVLVVRSALGARRFHRANPALVAVGIYLTHVTYGLGFLLGLTRPELDH